MNAFSIAIALTLIDKLTEPLRKIKSQIEELNQTFKQTSQHLHHMEESYRRTGKVVEQIQRQFAKFGETLQKIQNIGQDLMISNSAKMMLTIAPGLKAMDFEYALAEVASLTDKSLAEFKERYQNKLLEIGSDVETVKAMYQAVSAGLTPDEAISFLKLAKKAAIAGVSDIFTATDLFTSIKNAFQLPMEMMERVSDITFQAVKLGKTTFPEIARNFQQVGSIAASAGISYENIMAILAGATAEGISTERVMTGLKYAIESLLSPSEQAKKVFQELGITMGPEVLAKSDLIGALEIIRQKLEGLSESKKAEYFSKIFGSMEAQLVIRSYFTDPKKYQELFKEMQNSAGATEKAYQKLAESTSMQLKQMKSELQKLFIAFGSLMLPSINAFLKAVTSLLKPLNSLLRTFLEKHKTVANLIGILFSFVAGFYLFKAAVGAVLFFTGKFGLSLRNIIKDLKDALVFIIRTAKGLWLKTLALYHNTIALIKWAITGRSTVPWITAMDMKLLKLRLTLKAFTLTLWENIKAKTIWLISLAKTATSAVFSRLISALRGVTLAIRAFNLSLLFSPVGLFIAGIAAIIGIGYLLYRNWDKVVKAISTAWEWLKNNWKKLAQFLLLLNPFTALLLAINVLIKKLLGISLFEAGARLVSSFVEGIKSMASKPIEAFKSIVQKIRNFLPFSPAKEGPLRDIHQIKLVETIAQGLTPSPLLEKMKQVLEPVKASVQPLLQPVKQVLEPVKASVQPVKLGAPTSISITVNLGPVNFAKGSAEEIHSLTSQLEKEIRKVLDRIAKEKFRREY